MMQQSENVNRLENEGVRKKIFHAQTIGINQRRASLALLILLFVYNDESFSMKFQMHNPTSNSSEPVSRFNHPCPSCCLFFHTMIKLQGVQSPWQGREWHWESCVFYWYYYAHIRVVCSINNIILIQCNSWVVAGERWLSPVCIETDYRLPVGQLTCSPTFFGGDMYVVCIDALILEQFLPT